MIKLQRFLLHDLDHLPDLFDPQRRSEPERFSPDEPLHVFALDKRDVIAISLPVHFHEPRGMRPLFVPHILQHFRR